MTVFCQFSDVLMNWLRVHELLCEFLFNHLSDAKLHSYQSLDYCSLSFYYGVSMHETGEITGLICLWMMAYVVLVFRVKSEVL